MINSIKVAFAVGRNGEFGLVDGLPWGKPFKEDMEAFKEFTKGCVLVMGSNTFASLPFAMKSLDRDCVVISRNSLENPPQAKNGDLADEYACTRGVPLEAMLHYFSQSYNKPVCVIGGASLIEQAVPLADFVLFTTVGREDGMEMLCDVSIDFNALKLKETTVSVLGSDGSKALKPTCVEENVCTEREYVYTIRKLSPMMVSQYGSWWK